MIPKPINILLVVDHKLSREGLSLLIKSFDKSIALHHASDSVEALQILTSMLRVDIVLLDIQAPVTIWVNTIKQLKNLQHRPHLLALLHFDEKPLISYLIRLGTNGLLLRGSEPSELKDAIFGILERGYFYDAAILEIIQEKYFQ